MIGRTAALLLGAATTLVAAPPTTHAARGKTTMPAHAASAKKSGHVEIRGVDIYDVDGHRVHTLTRDQQAAGPHDVGWNGLDDAGRRGASGFYFYRLRAAGPGGRWLERAKKIRVVR